MSSRRLLCSNASLDLLKLERLFLLRELRLLLLYCCLLLRDLALLLKPLELLNPQQALQEVLRRRLRDVNAVVVLSGHKIMRLNTTRQLRLELLEQNTEQERRRKLPRNARRQS